MTHNDIYTKFMIEYDKANVTSSYPSLTEYEVATVLDKAYNALISQKITGNNVRRAGFEVDLKAITDIYPLIKQDDITLQNDSYIDNVKHSSTPDDFLYFVNAYLNTTPKTRSMDTTTTIYALNVNIDTTIAIGRTPTGEETSTEITSPSTVFIIPKGTVGAVCNVYVPDRLKTLQFYVGYIDRLQNQINGVTIYTAEKLADGVSIRSIFDVAVWPMSGQITTQNYILLGNTKANSQSMPYDTFVERKLPVLLVNHQIAAKFFSTAYNMPWIKIPVCYIEDNILNFVYDPLNNTISDTAKLVYIKKPNTFVKDLDKFNESVDISYFDCSNASATTLAYYQFECNDTVAEELISLAIAFALENIESQRLNAKLNMRGLEG